MKKRSELAKAVHCLARHLRKDADYRYVWRANIAMAFKDTRRSYMRKTGKRYLNGGDIHAIANDAAENFLNLLCGGVGSGRRKR